VRTRLAGWLDLGRVAFVVVVVSGAASCSHRQAPAASTPAPSAPPALDSEQAFSNTPEDPEWSTWLRQVRRVVATGAAARRACAQLAGTEQVKCSCAEACRLQFPPLPHGTPHASVEWPPLIALEVNAAGTVDTCRERQTTTDCSRMGP
jgi:hypothetical protein